MLPDCRGEQAQRHLGAHRGAARLDQREDDFHPEGECGRVLGAARCVSFRSANVIIDRREVTDITSGCVTEQYC